MCAPPHLSSSFAISRRVKLARLPLTSRRVEYPLNIFSAAPRCTLTFARCSTDTLSPDVGEEDVLGAEGLQRLPVVLADDLERPANMTKAWSKCVSSSS